MELWNSGTLGLWDCGIVGQKALVWERALPANALPHPLKYCSLALR